MQSTVLRLIQCFLPRQNLDKIYLFVHLPKCAGTTVLKMCSEVGSNRCVVVAETRKKQQALDLMHSRIVEQNIAVDQLDLIMGRSVFYGMHECSPRDPYYFTFLRDPIERYISQYSYYVKCVLDPTQKGHEMAKQRVVKNGEIVSIKQFAKQNQSHNILTRTLAAASSERESRHNSWYQVDLAVASEQAEWMLNQMSFIGFVDQFERDISFVSEKLKIKPELRHVNESDSSDLEIEQETVDLILDNNQLDLKTYELAKEIARKSASDT